MQVTIRCEGFDKVRDKLALKGHGLQIGQAALRGMNAELVPYDTGKLRRGAYAGDMRVTYSGGVDYASYVYHGRGHARYPRSSLSWPEDYEKTGMKEVVEEIERIIEK